MSYWNNDKDDLFDEKSAFADLEEQGGDPWEISRVSDRRRDDYLKEYGLDPDRYKKSAHGGYEGSEEGCYIATCVYGSYDCPQVRTLRRFRDDHLRASAPGRCFIRLYYAASPALVRRFGGSAWFHTFWRGILDRLIAILRAKEVSDAPCRGRDRRQGGTG